MYRIVVEAAGQNWPSVPSSRQSFDLAPVQLSVETDKASGRAQLRWTQFQGPDFQGYRVERRSEEEADFGMIGRATEVADTAFTDTTLAPDISYFYRVVVVAGGREWFSASSGQQSFELQRIPTLAHGSADYRGIEVSWSPFVDVAFQRRYRVQRQEVGTDVVVTIREESDQTRSGFTFTFTDTNARSGVSYEYWVVEEAAGQEVAGSSIVARFELPKVVVPPPTLFSTTASAELKWTKYFGPYFRAYRVERHIAGTTPQVLAEISDREINSYVDTGLVGNTEYFYRVVVVTTRDEEVESEEVSGVIHQLLTTWPLEVEEGEYVRLYWEGDHLTALVAGRQRVRLFLFDAQGALMEEQVLLDRPPQNIEPRSVAAYLSPEGRRYVSAAYGETVGVLGFGADGQPRYQEHPVFADSLSAISRDYLTVRKRVSISYQNINSSNFYFDQVEVSAGGQVLFEEDFEGEPEDWDVIDKNRMVEGRYSGAASKSDEAWQDFYLEAEVLFGEQEGGNIAIGTGDKDNSSRFTFYLYPVYQKVQLSWTFRPDPNSSLTRQSRVFPELFSLFPGPPYRMGLGFREGQFSASISSPLVWSGAREGRAPWASLAGIGQALLLMHGPQPRTLSPEGEETLRRALEEQASETRSWKWESRRGPENWLGFCLPARHQLRFNRLLLSPSGEVSWPGGFRALGAGVGQDAGELIFPLSFDASPDGRIYVLDAGNGRIQVFDTEGKYITQWGHRGSGEGEFDFGSGRVPEDFAGSVAVDNEGYIYVADVGNKRIQKFAP